VPANTTEPANATQSVIHDLGYKSYDGPRIGRAGIVRALAWSSFRSAFGFGRSFKAKIVPILILIVVCLPAIVNAAMVSHGNPRITTYDVYQSGLRTFAMLVFVAVQAPELVSRDLRSRVLPLYFSRPLKPIDYPLAKYIAFAAALLVMMWVPLLVLYFGTIVSLHGGSAVWHETQALFPGLLIGLMWAVVLAAVGLFFASLSGRRAFATGAVAIFLFLTWVLANIIVNAETRPVPVQCGPNGCISLGPPPTVPIGAKIGGLFSPFTLMDGVRRWLGGLTPDAVPKPGSFGVVYAIVLIALVAGCLYGLAARYRKASLS
jgi:ABC-2 type transport system permease protein